MNGMAVVGNRSSDQQAESSPTHPTIAPSGTYDSGADAGAAQHVGVKTSAIGRPERGKHRSTTTPAGGRRFLGGTQLTAANHTMGALSAGMDGDVAPSASICPAPDFDDRSPMLFAAPDRCRHDASRI